MSFEEAIFNLSENNSTQTQESGNGFHFGMSLRNNIGQTDIQNNPQTSATSDESKIILCILHQSGYLGAAYYTLPDSELHVLSDTLDLKPDFIIAKNLYNQIKPTHTITLGTKASKFVTALAHIAQFSEFEENSNIPESDERISNLPYQIELLKKDKYSYGQCLYAVQNVKLSCEPSDATDEERKFFLRSLLNFEKRVSIHALGALLIYLGNNYNIIQANGVENLLYLNIYPISLNNIVLMNDNIIEGLMIFNVSTHPSGEKMYNTEGLSIYNLFNRCKSTVGSTHLKSLLLRPTNNILTLKRRHEFIEFCLKPVNQSIVSSIEECLKNILPVGASLQKIYRNQDSLNNWKILHTTLHNILYIKQICEPHVKKVQIFQEFVSDVSDVIEYIIKEIRDTIDFESSNGHKIRVRIGVNELLDQKKRYRSNIHSKIDIAASHELKNIPSYVKECAVIYIPQIGYLAAIKNWGPDAKYQDLENYGYRHMFTLGDIFHCKSAVCDELDKCLGDIHTEIEELETSIIDQLGEKIMANNWVFKKPMRHIAQFDSFICFAQVAKQLGYICPNLVNENIIEIEDGRHALLDLSGTNFIPNSFHSGGQNSVIKIITGPNNSGKSIYLRQTALIVYLAHIGSYVPAKAATIGMMYSFHSNISENLTSSNEIISNMSGFATSLRQMSQASCSSNKNSLLIIDEFGRATSELDGLALLTSFLEHYLLRDECCPHILVSTHYLRLTNLIPESNFVQHLKCDFKLFENKLVYLYKIIKGVSNSYAKYTALNFGIPETLVKRSEQIAKYYQDQIKLQPICPKS